MELFWRKRPDWITSPVCAFSESEWFLYLFDAQYNPSIIALTDRDVITPDHQKIPSLTITKTVALTPTSLVIDSDNPKLLGAILGLKEHADHALRPLRPHVSYSVDSQYGEDLFERKHEAGFNESEPYIDVLMEVLRRLAIPVNPRLPEVVQSYWPE